MKTSFALDSLSYSGRLVQTNGAPVTGTVTIRAELVYTNNTSVVLCSDDIAGVVLSKGVFHVKLEFACTGGKTLTQVLSQAPTGESVAIQITDMTNSKSYSFQALHALPYANVASQLVQMGAADGEFLKWNNTTKQWGPGGVSGASGGTVTNVSVGSPLSISNPTTTPSISLQQANGSQSGYLSSADWNSFNSKEGTIAGGTASQYYRGDKTWQTLDSSVVPENVNLYFTNARALGVPLTGFVTAAGAIVATDTTLAAFGKAQGQINTINSAAANYLIKNSTDSITGLVNVGTTGLLQLVYVPVGMNDATNKAYVDSEVGNKVSKAGDTVTGVLTLDNDLRIKGGSNHVTVRGHATSANYNLILPSGAGTNGQFLQTDGSGNLSWVAQSSTAAPTGSAGGDLAGTYPNPTVPGLASKISTTLNSGNILVGNGSNVATAVAVSGDATLSNTGALTLANSGATAGTYKSVTVDAKGRVTGGTNPTTLAGYGITDTLVTGVSVTAPITNTGTAAVPLIGMPVATGSTDGYLSSANFNTFNNKQDAINSSSTITTGSLTSSLQGGLILNPFNTGAGNTGELRFKELVAGGTNYTGFKAPDALGGNVIYTLPSADGSSGQVLTTNSTGGLSWTTVSTSSSSLTGDIGGTIGANTIGAGKVTLTHLSASGTRDNTTYLRGDNTFTSFAADVRTSVLTGLSTSTNAVITAADSVLSSLGKLQKQISDFAVSAVGGDLSGNLPNPTVAKIRGTTVSSTAPLAGQVLKFNSGTPAWEPSYVLMPDLKSSVSGNLFPGTGCAVNQTLQYSIGIDAFVCVNIDSLDAGKITTGTIAAARLPSSATYWQAATGGINYGSGNVGIGTTTPGTKLQISTTNQFSIYQTIGVLTNPRYFLLGSINDNNGDIHLSGILGGHDNNQGKAKIDIKYSVRDGFKALGQVDGTIGTGSTILVYDDVANSKYLVYLKVFTYGLVNLNAMSSSGATLTYDGSYTETDPAGAYTLIHTLGIDAGGITYTSNSGNVGIGTSAPTFKLNVVDQNNAMIGLLQYNDTDGAAIRGYRSRGTIAAPTAVQSGDVLSALRGFGYTSAAAFGNRSAAVELVATENFTATSQGAAVAFQTTANGTNTSAIERMRINHNGNVGIGTSSPASKLEVRGDTASPSVVAVYGDNNQQHGYNFGSSLTDRWLLLQDTNDSLRFYGDHTGDGGPIDNTAFTILKGGNVGIGTLTPGTKLSVYSNTPGGYTVISNANAGAGGQDWRWYSSSTGAPLGANAMCFGTGACMFTLNTAGNAVLSGTLTQSSDVRLKRDISSIKGALDTVMKLEGVSYFWKDSGKDPSKQVGLIAQAVEKVFPEVVKTDSKGFKSVAYQNLVAPIINAIHELKAMLNGTQDEVKNLKAEMSLKNQEINKLKMENDQIKKFLCVQNPKESFCSK